MHQNQLHSSKHLLLRFRRPCRLRQRLSPLQVPAGASSTTDQQAVSCRLRHDHPLFSSLPVRRQHPGRSDPRRCGQHWRLPLQHMAQWLCGPAQLPHLWFWLFGSLHGVRDPLQRRPERGGGEGVDRGRCVCRYLQRFGLRWQREHPRHPQGRNQRLLPLLPPRERHLRGETAVRATPVREHPSRRYRYVLPPPCHR